MDHTFGTISRRDFLLGVAGTAGTLLVQSCGDSGDSGGSASPAVVMLENVPLQAWNPGPSRFHPGVDRVLEILRDKGTPLLHTTASHPMGGTGGIVRPDDVVVIKVNGISEFIGSTNTDILGGLVARILDHPDGFEGEVALVDKYFFYRLPTRGTDANAEIRAQNFDFVATALGEQVATPDFFGLVGTALPYEPDPWKDGYVDLMTLFPEEPAFAYLSYPRFTTARGTHIDLRRGVYEGGEFHDRLRFIDVPVLKHHGWMGMTAALKNLFGILNIGTILGTFFGIPGVWDRWLETHHQIHSNGLFGRFMRHIRHPDLTLLDAMHILNQPPFGPIYSRSTPTDAWKTAATLVASSSPVAVDHAAAAEIMYPTPVRTPCSSVGKQNCQDPPPCLATPGYCERYRPDLEDDRAIAEEKWGDPSDPMYLNGGAPVNAVTQYLRTAAAAVTGRPDAEPGDYLLTRERF